LIAHKLEEITQLSSDFPTKPQLSTSHPLLGGVPDRAGWVTLGSQQLSARVPDRAGWVTLGSQQLSAAIPDRAGWATPGSG